MPKLILKYYDVMPEDGFLFADSNIAKSIYRLYKSVEDKDVIINVGQELALMVCRALVKRKLIDNTKIELYYNDNLIEVTPDGREKPGFIYKGILDQTLEVILGWDENLEEETDNFNYNHFKGVQDV